MEQENITLPIQVASRVDVVRLLREIDQVDNFLKQAAIREPGTTVRLPKTSRLLEELTSDNKLNLLLEADRLRLAGFLAAIKAKAPLLHISFSAEPAPLFIQKLLTWLRTEIHPSILLHIGLQPGIGAGCTIRGNSLYLDLSLRRYFQKQRPLLLDKLHEGAEQSQQKPVQAALDSTEVAQPSAAAVVGAQAEPGPQVPASDKLNQEAQETVAGDKGGE